MSRGCPRAASACLRCFGVSRPVGAKEGKLTLERREWGNPESDLARSDAFYDGIKCLEGEPGAIAD